MQLELGQPIGFTVMKIGHGWSGEAKKEGRCNKCELVGPCVLTFLYCVVFVCS